MSESESASGRLRIGEFSRRVGESPEVLRAWETRYSLVAPDRTNGRLRLYSERDERRVRVMRHHIDAGLSASEAARLAKLADNPQSESSASVAEIEVALEHSFDALDEPAAQAALDRVLTAFAVEQALGDVILPFLQRLGERWASGETSVAHEHFASNVIGGRLRELSRGWADGVGPRVILACPSGEHHELGLLSFGVVLRGRGWRVTYLGADTPVHDISELLANLDPAIVVLAATTPQRFLDNAVQLAALSQQVRVGLAGAGASAALAERVGAESLDGTLFEVASRLTP